MADKSVSCAVAGHANNNINAEGAGLKLRVGWISILWISQKHLQWMKPYEQVVNNNNYWYNSWQLELGLPQVLGKVVYRVFNVGGICLTSTEKFFIQLE
jgi:hypothetical protein